MTGRGLRTDAAPALFMGKAKRAMSITSSNWVPVWRYTEHAIAGLSRVTFRVRACDVESEVANMEGAVIYEGVSVAPPDGSGIRISINDIVAAYLSAPFLPATGARWCTQHLGGWFALDTYDEALNDWDVAASYYFTADYSYDYDFDLLTQGLPHPITGELAPNQWLVASVVDVRSFGEVSVFLSFGPGTEEQEVTVPLHRYGDFNDDFNDDFAVDAGPDAVEGYIALYLGTYPGVQAVRVECGNVVLAQYTVREDTCRRYCLYYRNAYGGWDSLLLESAVRTEAYSRGVTGRWVDNSQPGAAAADVYRNAVTEGWRLSFGGLTDAQARRVPQLTGSVDVYLCDLVADTLLPLVLTDAETTVQTFRTNGHKRKGWTLTATTAQDRTRR